MKHTPRIVVISLVSSLAACASTAPVKSPAATAAPAPAAPDFALRDLSGATVKLSDYKGKTVLVDFWATWCLPCKESIPVYVEMQERLKDKGFVILGIDEDESLAPAKAYAREHALNYPVLWDSGTELFGKYRARSLPSTYLIDANGRIRARWGGFDSRTGKDVERAIESILTP